MDQGECPFLQIDDKDVFKFEPFHPVHGSHSDIVVGKVLFVSEEFTRGILSFGKSFVNGVLPGVYPRICSGDDCDVTGGDGALSIVRPGKVVIIRAFFVRGYILSDISCTMFG